MGVAALLPAGGLITWGCNRRSSIASTFQLHSSLLLVSSLSDPWTIARASGRGALTRNRVWAVATARDVASRYALYALRT